MRFKIILELSNNDWSLYVKLMTGAALLSIEAISALQPMLPIHEGLGKMAKMSIQGCHH
jgi:hypothetical protein